MVSSEIRQETSTTVQSRISFVTIAELDMYWARQGHKAKNKGQLVRWTVQLARDIIEGNGQLPMEFKQVDEAKVYLDERGLFTPSMDKRSSKKLSNSLTFENLRRQGEDPETVVGRQYHTVHNRHSAAESGAEPVTELQKKAAETYKELYGEEDVSDAEVEAQRKEALDKSLAESRALGKIAVVKEEGKSTAAEVDHIQQHSDARKVLLKEKGDMSESDLDTIADQQEEKDRKQIQEQKNAEPDMSKAITLNDKSK